MSVSVKEYWQEVHKQIEKLAKDNGGENANVYLMSLGKVRQGTYAGQVCHVTVQRAAELLVKDTHRLATKAEINAYHRRHEETRSRIAEEELRKRPVLDMSPQAAAAIAAASKTTSQAASGGPKGA